MLQEFRTRLLPIVQQTILIEQFFRSKRFMPKERVTQIAVLNNIPGQIFLRKEHISIEHEILFHML